jgi:beta-lactamase class A
MKQKFAFEPRWYAVIIFFFAGSFLGALTLFIWIFNGGHLYGIQKIHLPKSEYKFINPLLAVDVNQPLAFFENNDAKNKTNALIQQQKTADLLNVSGIYFQDLENGHWFGINEDTKFLVGKTLKLPIMIAYFKAAEANPAILKKIIVYHTQNDDPNAENQIDLQNGESYPIEEIIKDMVIDDSDSAANILLDNIDKQAIDQVYSDLGIDFKEDKTSNDYISAKQNTLFYRILYNATYLNREDSEKVLEILSQSDIGSGATRYIPKGIDVAHRHPPIQETTQNNIQTVQTGDCGIVYYPGHPYLLCVMAVAKNKDQLENFLGKVGEFVYHDISNRYKNN